VKVLAAFFQTLLDGAFIALEIIRSCGHCFRRESIIRMHIAARRDVMIRTDELRKEKVKIQFSLAAPARHVLVAP
jgi:hypothetical protein